MTRTNATLVSEKPVTHEGGRAARIDAKEQLLRVASSTMLFENTFYESGASIAARLAKLVGENDPAYVKEVAIKCREDLKLRHAPLWLAVQMTLQFPHGGRLAREAIAAVAQRPDELAEVVALFYKAKADVETAGLMGTLDRKSTKGGTKLPSSMKRGLADAFTKFDEYRLAKWNRLDREVKLRDVLFLTHPKAQPDEARDALWKRLVTGTLTTPDTWEVAYSAAKTKEEKRAIWQRLIEGENGRTKLGGMATLMNMRNMVEAGLEREHIVKALSNIGPHSRLLPFRFVSAAEHAPQYAEELSAAMLRAVEDFGKLPGKTALCIDISGSMRSPISEKSTVSAAKMAATLGALLREVCEEARVYVFGTEVAEVQNLRGLGLVNAVAVMNNTDAVGSGTDIAKAVNKAAEGNPDRIIIVTDEQGHTVPNRGWKGYIVNVRPYGPGIETDKNVTRVNGFSERLVDWIALEETGRILSASHEAEGAEA